MGPGLIALSNVARHTGQPARASTTAGHPAMRSLHVAAVTRNVERSADETAEGSHNCGEIVRLIGSEPTKLDQRVDCAALDFAEETDFAPLRARRWAHTSPDHPLDKIDQRMREGFLVAIGCGQPAQVDQTLSA